MIVEEILISFAWHSMTLIVMPLTFLPNSFLRISMSLKCTRCPWFLTLFPKPISWNQTISSPAKTYSPLKKEFMCLHLWEAFPVPCSSKTNPELLWHFFHSLSTAVYLRELLLHAMSESISPTSYKFREEVECVLFIVLSSKPNKMSGA